MWRASYWVHAAYKRPGLQRDAAGPAGGARGDARDRTAMLRVTVASDLGFGREEGVQR